MIVVGAVPEIEGVADQETDDANHREDVTEAEVPVDVAIVIDPERIGMIEDGDQKAGNEKSM